MFAKYLPCFNNNRRQDGDVKHGAYCVKSKILGRAGLFLARSVGQGLKGTSFVVVKIGGA